METDKKFNQLLTAQEVVILCQADYIITRLSKKLHNKYGKTVNEIRNIIFYHKED